MNLTKRLYNSREHSDISIVSADSIEVKVHKLILAARSPVFKELILNLEAREGEKNRLIIDGDFDGDTVQVKHCGYN